ncbi:hypothetical protein LJC14_01410 [Treponema sp. OttesenSCG-928-L16]|nr:hypothetical protein [Treponema sp. OttesenSCG-928-L16]
MDKDKNLEPLHAYAAEYKFNDFSALFAQLTSSLPEEEFLDAYLMRAQIKLFALDESFTADLKKAGAINAVPRFPCLNKTWLPDSPNRLVVFGKNPGMIRRFLGCLAEGREMLDRWYGETGQGMARQLESEILYFMGDFSGALDLAEKQYARVPKPSAGGVMAQYVLFRGYLAARAPEKAEQCMLDMVKMAKACPECLAPYGIVRDWANLTTGWSGDTPRFHGIPDGKVQPFLDDRLTAIQQGISQVSLLETPFVEYAKQSYGDSCVMRQYYMDIFHAIYWFQTGELLQAKTHFIKTYRISSDSGLIMPFVEYGRQIIPLLKYMNDSGADCSPEWIAKVSSLAEQYEESINRYRG